MSVLHNIDMKAGSEYDPLKQTNPFSDHNSPGTDLVIGKAG